RKVASDAMTWPQLAQFGVLDVAEAHLRNRAPGMEMASGREVDEIRRLPRKRLADDETVRGVRVRDCAHQRLRIRMQRLPEDRSDGALLHDPTRGHYPDPVGEVHLGG